MLALNSGVAISYLHDMLLSQFERRARAVKNFQFFFQIRTKYSSRGFLGMRRVCTRIYGARSMSTAIFTC
jgi:hypothetical protein